MTVKRAADQREPKPQHSTQPSDRGERYEILKDAVAALKRAAKVRETDVTEAKADMDDKEGAFSRANAAVSRNASARLKKAKTEAKSASMASRGVGKSTPGEGRKPKQPFISTRYRGAS